MISENELLSNSRVSSLDPPSIVSSPEDQKIVSFPAPALIVLLELLSEIMSLKSDPFTLSIKEFSEMNIWPFSYTQSSSVKF